MHDRESITPQAREERLEAYARGREAGLRLLEQSNEFNRDNGSCDPYLHYQYLLGISQAIANHGRDIAGIGGKHDLDPQKRGNKA